MRSTRGSKNKSSSNDDLSEMPPGSKDNVLLWCLCDPTKEFILTKNMLPEPLLYWPARVMKVTHDDLAHELEVLGLKVVVPIHCGLKNLSVQFVRADECRHIDDAASFEEDLKGGQISFALQQWKASIRMAERLVDS